MNELVYLIGFSGTGKSSVARLIAQALRWSFIDMDEEIESSCGKSISEIFQTKGEKWFRDEESKLLNNISVKNKHIISTGGGVPVKDQNMNLMLKTGYVICLDASVDQIVARLSILAGKDNKLSDRPKITNLSIEDISNFKSERANIYSMANFTINTNHLTVEQVTNELLKSINKFLNKLNVIEWQKIDDFCTSVENINNIYPVYVGSDLYEKLPQMLKPFLIKHKVFLLADDGSKLYMRKIQKVFELNKIKTTTLVLNSGEQSKSLENTSSIYEWLSSEHADRDDILLGIGGGMVGDISGYVAATYMRGIKFVLIPTTLLSQVDSSVGGKTGVNHTLGKNMIGAFHQPRAVIIDVDTLDTLPIREFSAGMAEVIKYGLLTNIDFLSDLEKNIDSIKRGLHQEDKGLLIDAIYRSCSYKAEIVSVDEFESGVRRLLNLGHTFGHSIENVLGYGTYLHGEAVAIGMCMAARLSQLEGNLSAGDVERVKSILTLAGLPCSIGKYNITATQLYKAMLLDKKVNDGNIRLVLFLWLGNAYISQDYSEENLKQVLSEFCHS